MKKIVSFLVLFAFVICLQAQGQNSVYKTLNDSIFKKGDIVRLPKIYFYMGGKHQIIQEHRDSLLLVRNFLIKYSDLTVQIACHTDLRGSVEGNAKISESRARGLINYLVKEGISENRLTFFGYGESKTIISQEVIDAESDLQQKEVLYAKNRRTVLIIQ